MKEDAYGLKNTEEQNETIEINTNTDKLDEKEQQPGLLDNQNIQEQQLLEVQQDNAGQIPVAGDQEIVREANIIKLTAKREEVRRILSHDRLFGMKLSKYQGQDQGHP
ncbi:MAG: hypothetical protein K6B14_12030 [Lachnospiraceae bacterium]|nr:hypothetical protein [Lachnospiraceae bacterium]